MSKLVAAASVEGSSGNGFNTDQGDQTRAELSLSSPPTNDELAEHLETAAKILLQQGANRFRIEAYETAATTLRQHDGPVWKLYFQNGTDALQDLPGIGRSISRALRQMIVDGRWAMLDRLLGHDIAERSFASIPNVGPKLAKRIHDELGIESLGELQAAAWDGRLQSLAGFGEKRLRAVRESLEARGRRSVKDSELGEAHERVRTSWADDLVAEIPVAEILDIDREYRLKASRNVLPRVAPRRFNPTAASWLPILHTQRGDRQYTALFSNTLRAHELGTTHDWVVIYLENHRPDGPQGRWTVITSQFGKLKGRRLVRGRESDCVDYYAGEEEKTEADVVPSGNKL